MSDLERLNEALDHGYLVSNLMRDIRDVVDPFVAETLYEEHIAHNVDARGGMASESDWPSWDELPQAALDYWMGLAVAARLATRAALINPPTEEE